MPFQPGHKFRFTKENPRPGPGRPKSKEKESRDILRKMMTEARIRRLTKEELEKAQSAAAVLACTDFNYFKFIMDREDDYADEGVVAVQSLSDVIRATHQVMKKVADKEITVSKSRKLLDMIKQARDLHIEDAIDAAENIRKAKGS